MINLLPPDLKYQIRAGQSNTLLLRYCIASLILAAILFVMVAGVYFFMNNSQKAAIAAIEESDSRNASYANVQQQANEFNNDLATAKVIFDKEIKYTNIAIAIAQALPSGVILENLNLDAQTFGQPTIISALGRNYDDAISLKTSFENSSIFSDVHLQSVTQNPEGDYPVSIVINVTINPEIAKQ